MPDLRWALGIHRWVRTSLLLFREFRNKEDEELQCPWEGQGKLPRGQLIPLRGFSKTVSLAVAVVLIRWQSPGLCSKEVGSSQRVLLAVPWPPALRVTRTFTATEGVTLELEPNSSPERDYPAAELTERSQRHPPCFTEARAHFWCLCFDSGLVDSGIRKHEHLLLKQCTIYVFILFIFFLPSRLNVKLRENRSFSGLFCKRLLNEHLGCHWWSYPSSWSKTVRREAVCLVEDSLGR